MKIAVAFCLTPPLPSSEYTVDCVPRTFLCTPLVVPNQNSLGRRAHRDISDTLLGQSVHTRVSRRQPLRAPCLVETVPRPASTSTFPPLATSISSSSVLSSGHTAKV